MAETAENPLGELVPHMGDTKIAPPVGIAAIALQMAIKYHDINTVQDGALYQQYKLEGRNMRELHLDVVFETAIQIERHLLASNNRVADILIEALEVVVSEPSPDTQPSEVGHG